MMTILVVLTLIYIAMASYATGSTSDVLHLKVSKSSCCRHIKMIIKSLTKIKTLYIKRLNFSHYESLKF